VLVAATFALGLGGADAAWRVQLLAPDALRTMIETHADLMRYRDETGLAATEVRRLASTAPEQLRQLLATEGYFNPEIDVSVTDAADGVPDVRLEVRSGPRARVNAVTWSIDGAIERTADAEARIRALRQGWSLPVGAHFTESAWSEAKSSTLAELWRDRFPAARFARSEARVDADQNTVSVTLVLDSGPLYRVGDIAVSGLVTLPRTAVLNLAPMTRGTPYAQQDLLRFQDRLLASGLFDAAAVSIDTSGASPEAASIQVQVRERLRHAMRLGAGYSTVVGPRLSGEYTDLRLFGSDWQGTFSGKLARDDRSFRVEVMSYPHPDLYRTIASASLARIDVGGVQIVQQLALAGRRRDGEAWSERHYAAVQREQLTTPLGHDISSAATANVELRWSRVDDLVFPTRGYALSGAAALGVTGGPDARGRLFGRLNGRASWFTPLGDAWYGQARIELGRVLARDTAGIPQTLLFRTGGVDSVRGYSYQSIGVPQGGSVPPVAVAPRPSFILGGSFLATASVEVAREVRPNWFAAAFVDAGDAAASLRQFRAAVGYGIGARWRSPIGPVRVDLSYGQEVRKLRLDFAVGVTF